MMGTILEFKQYGPKDVKPKELISVFEQMRATDPEQYATFVNIATTLAGTSYQEIIANRRRRP